MILKNINNFCLFFLASTASNNDVPATTDAALAALAAETGLLSSANSGGKEIKILRLLNH